MDKITAEEAKKAARTLRAYCKQKPPGCYNCTFYAILDGCRLLEAGPPESWKLPGDKNEKQGG